MSTVLFYVIQVAFATGHRSADVAVCYVEFKAIGTRKLLRVEDVVQGHPSLHPPSSCSWHLHSSLIRDRDRGRARDRDRGRGREPNPKAK